VLVEIRWQFQNRNFTQIFELINEDDEEQVFGDEYVTCDLIDAFKKDGYLILRNLDDGDFSFMHVDLVKRLTIL
jgi:hypothetical protein